MSALDGVPQQAHYLSQVGLLVWQSVRRLMRPPSHSRRSEARRRMARRGVILSALASLAILPLMFLIDVPAIRLMPPRGTVSLWPLQVFTELAKSTYLLWALAALLLLIVLTMPRLRGLSQSVLAALSVRVQYLFLSVFVAMLAGEVLKFVAGRGRPFVGGEPNAFNFSPFAGTPAFASLPSGHALAAFALAFAVSALWPRWRVAMWTYAVLICVSRIVLLAHHPSDVVAGALTGVIAAMFVRYWFAARRLGFKIGPDGAIAPLEGPSSTGLKRVAREAFAT